MIYVTLYPPKPMSKILKKLRLRVVIRRYEAIILGSVLLLSGAVMPSSWEPPFHAYPAPHVDAQPQHPWIALTFDDGPHVGKTEELLAVLREAHVPATFFVVGKMADRYPQLVRQIAREGHELANHSYSHPDMSRLNDNEVMTELEQTREVIERLTGQEAYYFRPPGGDFSRRMVRLTAKAGYRMVLWSVLTRDVEGATPALMRSRILKGADDGGIVLMHSGMKTTVDMLPGVIAQLRDRGYHFVTVSTLLGMKSVPSATPSKAPVLQTASSIAY
jgi:peptidoglycan/xylan/chitin deacetylase (PgdA/CDA1 family)